MEDRSGEPSTWNTVMEKLQPGKPSWRTYYLENSSGETTTWKTVVENLQPGIQ